MIDLYLMYLVIEQLLPRFRLLPQPLLYSEFFVQKGLLVKLLSQYFSTLCCLTQRSIDQFLQSFNQLQCCLNSTYSKSHARKIYLRQLQFLQHLIYWYQVYLFMIIRQVLHFLFQQSFFNLDCSLLWILTIIPPRFFQIQSLLPSLDWHHQLPNLKMFQLLLLKSLDFIQFTNFSSYHRQPFSFLLLSIKHHSYSLILVHQIEPVI